MLENYYASVAVESDLDDPTECVGTKEEVENFILQMLREAPHKKVLGILCGKLVEVCADRAQLLESGVAEDVDGTVSIWGLHTPFCIKDHYWIQHQPLAKYYRCVGKSLNICIGE